MTPNRTGGLPTVQAEPRWDATVYLGVWLVLLYGVSARQVLGPLGAIGQPALLLALGCLVLWAYGWLVIDSGFDRRRHPIRPWLLAYGAMMIASYAIAMNRPLTELELSESHRALIVTLAMIALALFAADGLRSVARTETLLRILVVMAALVSVMAILQFYTGATYQFRVPGLQWLGDDNLTNRGRSGFNRPRGTTLHPIELSVVTASLLPLAIHFAMFESTQVRRRNFGTCAALIALVIPMAVSRSGIVAVVVSLGLLALGWTWSQRIIGAVVGFLGVCLVWLTVPGLVGTIRSLFTSAEHDPSVQARIDRVPRIMEHIREYPWFGRGNGTWSLDDYFLIDNQFWVTTIETGVVGMTFIAAMLIFSVGTGLAIRSLPLADVKTGMLARAVAASTAGLAISILTFDAFFYRMLTGTLFLLIGVIGALWRLCSATESLTSSAKGEPMSVRGSRSATEARPNPETLSRRG